MDWLRSCCVCSILLTLVVLERPCRAGDWPQILGPHRNGRADGESLTAWSSAGPATRWTFELGQGYAGPVVSGERVVVFHRVDDVERVEALDAKSGRSLWKADFEAVYRGGINPDTGPRSTPLVHEGKVYVFGAAGDLHCVSLEEGEKIWSRSTYEEFGGQEGFFGAGTTPIVLGDRLLLNVGGRRAGLVAFSLSDGETVWEATSEAASYSSPAATLLGGTPHAIFVTRLNVLAVRARDGKVRFQFPFGQRGPTVNAATPLVFDGDLFVSASYGVGARLVRLQDTSFQEVWSNDGSMSSQYATAVYHQGYLYGVHGREDIGQAEYRCVEAGTGEVRWSESLGVAHTILAGDKLLILTVDGRLLLAEASTDRFEVLAEAEVATDTTRALPALAGGKFYFRTNSSRGGVLKCLSWE